jgi:DEAD/DEAH box helicase domain-containing protein
LIENEALFSNGGNSGKSLIYQIPVLDSLLKDGSSKAMYIFPTKALAQDQLRSLQDIISACEGIEDVKVNYKSFSL